MRKTSYILFFLLSVLLLTGCGADEPAVSEETVPPLTIQGRNLSPESSSFSVYGEVDSTELDEVFSRLGENVAVVWENCPLTAKEQSALTERHPDTRWIWDVELEGLRRPNRAVRLSLEQAPADVSSLADTLRLFPDLKTVELTAWVPDAEEAALLYEACPHALFHYTVSLLGREFDTASEELDLSNIKLKDTEELEDALIHFPRLKKADLSYCGLHNEELAALNDRYENIRFVWVVNVFSRAIRTDETYFIQYNRPRCDLEGSRAVNLKYCTDLVALDLGHTGLLDWEMDFLPYMPHLKYLLLSETQIKDLSDLACLKELIYFEAFLTAVNDISPLLECPMLTDLNLSYCFYMNEEAPGVLQQMDSVEQMYILGARFPQKDIDAIIDAHPDCNVQWRAGPESTGAGWRQNPHYFDLRDELHMPYMW